MTYLFIALHYGRWAGASIQAKGFLAWAREFGYYGVPGRTGRTADDSGAEEVRMPYKLDGAKFPTLDELVEALYPLYADKMSIEEFRKYAEEHAEQT
jgi:hypothetical protein